MRTTKDSDERIRPRYPEMDMIGRALFTLRIAAIMTWNPVLEPLDEKISKYIGGNPVRVDGKPRVTGIMDTVCRVSFVGLV